MKLYRLADIDLSNQRVLIRADLNVPMTGKSILNDYRIKSSLATIRYCLSKNAHVIVCSHLGRPAEGHFDERYSLQPVATRLGELLGGRVSLVRDWQRHLAVTAGEVVLLENIRFFNGETSNDEILARQLADICDVFVMDAFGTAHRAHASTYGVALAAPRKCAGLLMSSEIDAISKVISDPDRPLVALVGGAKVSSKLAVLENLTGIVDTLVVGGGMANTFLCAAGFNVGNSLVEKELLADAEAIMNAVNVPLPVDLMTTLKIGDDTVSTLRLADEVRSEEMIVDIGPVSARSYAELIANAKTIVWNGPMGIFEYPQFAEGTKKIAQAIGSATGYSLVGGGETVAALDHYEQREGVNYVSTGGGAFLEFIEGKKLPGVEVLMH